MAPEHWPSRAGAAQKSGSSATLPMLPYWFRISLKNSKFIFQNKKIESLPAGSVGEPPLFWAAPAPDGQCPGANSKCKKKTKKTTKAPKKTVLRSRHFFGWLRLQVAKGPEPTLAPTYLGWLRLQGIKGGSRRLRSIHKNFSF